jgi:hypothetical protein
MHEAGDGLLEELALPEDLREFTRRPGLGGSTPLRRARAAHQLGSRARTSEEEHDRRRQDGRQGRGC